MNQTFPPPSRSGVDVNRGTGRGGFPGLAATRHAHRPSSSAAGFLLSRTCRLADFDGCLSVAAWQQQLADAAWARWAADDTSRTGRAGAWVVNYSGCPFQAPGPGAAYEYRNQRDAQPRRVSAFYALCVLEHVEAPLRILTHATRMLWPGGLVVLTFAYWDADGPDTATGAGSRVRIYNPHRVTKLIREVRNELVTYGGRDWTYHGHTLEDHTLASLVLVRR